jgi:type IV pilus assembly protein PilC
MPRFRYKAVNAEGNNISGEYAAPDMLSVVSMLRGSGYFPTGVTNIGEDVVRVTTKKISLKSLAAMCKHMAAMLRTGVSISDTLEIMRSQTEDKELKKLLEDVFQNVLRGVSLFDAFSPYKPNFPDMFLNMIEAGEASGKLDSCIERAGQVFTRSSKTNNRIRNAMIYPIVLVSVMVLMLTGIMVFVIPQFQQLFAQNNASLPLITQILVSMSDFVRNRWYILVSVIVVIVLGFNFWLSNRKGRIAFDKFRLGMPIVGKMLKVIYASRYAQMLSSMNMAGVPLGTALGVTARSIGNAYIEEGLYDVSTAVNEGERLSTQLVKLGMLPLMLVHLTRLGEESGTMDELLDQAADFYDSESESAIQALTSLLEPLMIVIMAIILVPVLLGILLPIFNMYQTIG